MARERSVRRLICILSVTVLVTASTVTNAQKVFTSADSLLSECGKSSWRNNEDCMFHFSVVFTALTATGGTRSRGTYFPRDLLLREQHYIIQIRDAVILRLKSAHQPPIDLSTFERQALSQQWPCVIGEKAEELSARTIKDLCESSRREERLRCDQYLTWVEEEYQFQQFKFRSCVPTEASEKELRSAFLNYIRGRRLTEGVVGAEIALEALTKRWPCG